jgi:serine/threonine protein kinase
VSEICSHTPPNPELPELRLPRAADSVFDVGSNYTTQQIIGKGAFGHVIAAECNHTGSKVAIKKIKNATSDRVAALRLLREMRFLRQLRGHPNVINLQDVVVRESHQVGTPKNLAQEALLVGS